jgi:uncharacterized membrane protein YgcG
MCIGTIVRVALIGGTLALAGCQDLDPYTREGMWQPTGANQGNIAAMVANPQDLIHGRGQSVEDTKEPTLAINHIWTDTPKQLLDPGGGSSSSGSSGSGSGSGLGSSGGSGGTGGGSGSSGPGSGGN